MSIIEIFLTAIGLSMDAFAVAICRGLKMKRIHYRQMAAIAVLFGTFQAIMPLIGWMAGKRFEEYIISVDHWIAFALLAFLGGKMIYDSFKNDIDALSDDFNIKELLAMAVATSIDALAVGVTLAFLQTDIIKASFIIGITAFVLSAAGVFIGFKFGAKYKRKAAFAGGVILILIGLKILLEHLEIIQY